MPPRPLLISCNFYMVTAILAMPVADIANTTQLPTGTRI